MARVLSACVCALAFAVQAQTPRNTSFPKTETQSISGRVVSAETGDPVRKARVFAQAAEAGRKPPVFSDTDGRFVIAVRHGGVRAR